MLSMISYVSLECCMIYLIRTCTHATSLWIRLEALPLAGRLMHSEQSMTEIPCAVRSCLVASLVVTLGLGTDA